MEQNFEVCKKSIQAVSSIFSGKWTFMLMGELHTGPRRFNELNRELNISTKSLTDTLRQLEQNGVIKREAFATVPVTVEYSLTEKGRDFEQVFLAMKFWAGKWLLEK